MVIYNNTTAITITSSSSSSSSTTTILLLTLTVTTTTHQFQHRPQHKILINTTNCNCLPASTVLDPFLKKFFSSAVQFVHGTLVARRRDTVQVSNQSRCQTYEMIISVYLSTSPPIPPIPSFIILAISQGDNANNIFKKYINKKKKHALNKYIPSIGVRRN